VVLYFHSPNTPSWRGAQLKKAQGRLYFYLIYIIHICIWYVYALLDYLWENVRERIFKIKI